MQLPHETYLPKMSWSICRVIVPECDNNATSFEYGSLCGRDGLMYLVPCFNTTHIIDQVCSEQDPFCMFSFVIQFFLYSEIASHIFFFQVVVTDCPCSLFNPNTTLCESEESFFPGCPSFFIFLALAVLGASIGILGRAVQTIALTRRVFFMGKKSISSA